MEKPRGLVGTHRATGLWKTRDFEFTSFLILNLFFGNFCIVGVEEGHTMGDIHDSQADQSK